MDMLDELWQSGKSLDQVIAVANRMWRGEAHPLYAIHCADGLEQLNERAFAIDLGKFVASVEIHDLAKLVEHVHLPLQSGSDRILKIMRRHLPCLEFLLADGGLGSGLFIGIHNWSAHIVDECMLAALQKIVNIIRHAVEFLGADDEIDMRRGLKERLATGLSHAPEVAKNQVRPCFSEFAEHAHLTNRLLLGHVAHAASVQQNHIGLALGFDHSIATLNEHFRHLLGVALVHLAAIGLDVNAGHFLKAGNVLHRLDSGKEKCGGQLGLQIEKDFPGALVSHRGGQGGRSF